MFVRKKRNHSGSTCIQIISKNNGRYKVVKTVGCATQQHDIERLELQARQQLKELTHKGQMTLFESKTDGLVKRSSSH